MTDANKNGLRDSFVEMLFALALGQVAIHAYDIVDASPKSFKEMLPALSHLTLGGILIATSWVGWLGSDAPGRDAPTTVFSDKFVGLLIDVVLVVFYFLLVQDVEVEQAFSGTSTGNVTDGVIQTHLSTPTAFKEAFWLTWIFAIYAIWDFLHDGLNTFRECSWWKWLCLVVISCAVSVLSALLAWLATHFAEPQGARIHQVLAIDIALISLVMAFRAAKIIELPLANACGIANLQPFANKRVEKLRYLIICLSIYAVGIAFSGSIDQLTVIADKVLSKL